MRRRSAVLVGASVVAALVLSIPVLQATALADVGCGAVITDNVTLTKDLGPCSGNGVVIRADNITVDLGGHEIRGSGDRTDDRVGILLPNRRGVTIRNGSVTGFAAGVALVGGGGNTIKNLAVHDNIGPALRDVDFGDGILVDASSNNRLLSNTVGPSNGPLDGIGVIEGGANGNIISGNTIVGNNVAAPLRAGGPEPFNFNEGLMVSPLSGAVDAVISGTIITDNDIRDNGANGIVGVFQVQNMLIKGNRISGNGFGANAALNQGFSGLGFEEEGILFSAGVGKSTVDGNTVSGNADGGIGLTGCCFNPMTPVSGSNTVRNNITGGNQSLLGYPDLYDFFEPDCGSDVWRGNSWGFFPGTSLGSFFPDCVSVGGFGPRPGVYSEGARGAVRRPPGTGDGALASPARRLANG